MRRRAHRFVVLLGASLLSVVTACNLIVGVTDVRLREGALGDGGGSDARTSRDGSDPPIETPNIPKAALGERFSCARKIDGTVKCWGDDSVQQLGTEAAHDAGLATSAVATAITDSIDIAAGLNHACVVRRDGVVACWGQNLDGQVGNGKTSASESVPVDVTDPDLRAGAIAAGGNFTCAIRSEGGSVACWGSNAEGQLGAGTTPPSSFEPVAAQSLTSAIAIAAGLEHVCAVARNGAVWCWGQNRSGQLANNLRGSAVPRRVEDVPESIQVAAGERASCALTRQGTVYCWGANDRGQLGNEQISTTPVTKPAEVAQLNSVTAIAAGRNHFCALRDDGSVACWGAGERGQLGDDRTRVDGGAQPTYTVVLDLHSAVNIGAGGDHSCAPTDTGVVCWGSNANGQIGNGTVNPAILAPNDVIGF